MACLFEKEQSTAIVLDCIDGSFFTQRLRHVHFYS